MKLTNEQIAIITPVIANLKIICWALIGGVSMFAILSFVVTDWTKISAQIDMLPLIGIVIGVLGIAQAFVIPGIVAAAGVRSANDNTDKNSDDRIKKLAGMFQTKTIIGFAFLEGAAFVNLILFFVGSNLLPLGIVAFALAIMILQVPGEESATKWIEDGLEL